MDESNHHSSAYSSLANSTTEINNAAVLTMTPSKEIRHMSEDYCALLSRATEQIKVLAAEKSELSEQCDRFMTLNEELTEQLAGVLKREAAVKKENADVLRANGELFAEAQRLSDEEERWSKEKEKFEAEIKSLREEVETLDKKIGTEVKGTAARLREEGRKRLAVAEKEREAALTANKALEEKVKQLTESLRRADSDRESLQRRKEGVSGENLQLIAEAKQQEREFRSKVAGVQAQLQRSEDRCRKLEKENTRLRASKERSKSPSPRPAPPPQVVITAPQEVDKRLEDLLEKNKNLTEWREQLIEKNRLQAEENAKLRMKCQALEDLMNDEVTDINDVLELIRGLQMQGGLGGMPAAGMGPISKFRDLRKT